MDLTSAPLHKGQVSWMGILLTALLLTSWASATPSFYGSPAPLEAVPPHVAEGDNLLIRIPNIGCATISWFKELGFRTLDWARLARFSKSKGVYWKGEQYTDGHKIFDNGSMFIQNISTANGGKYDVFTYLDDRRMKLFATGHVLVHRELPLPFIQVTTTRVKELDPVLLTCSFNIPHYNALRYNSIRWLLNGQSLELMNRMKLSQKNSTLSIEPVIKEDSGEYQCELYNSQTSKKSEPIKLDIIESFTSLAIKVRPNPVKELNSVFLTCLLNNKDIYVRWFLNEISIRWLFNGQSLGLTDRMKLSQNNSTLIIDPVKREDSGEYQCEVSSPVSWKRSDPIHLDIISFPTTAQVTVEAVPPHGAKGKNVLLLVHNLPGTLQAFYWYRRETEVERSEIAGYLMFSNIKKTGPAYTGREIIYPNGSLLFQNVTQKDAGAYMLYMVTENFDFRSASLHFNVYHPVTKPMIQATRTILKEMDSVFLVCFSNDLETSISSFFNATSIHWLFNGQNLKLTFWMHLSQDNNTLEIIHGRREDSGEYQCEVSNPINSKRSDPIQLDIMIYA